MCAVHLSLKVGSPSFAKFFLFNDKLRLVKFSIFCSKRIDQFTSIIEEIHPLPQNYFIIYPEISLCNELVHFLQHMRRVIYAHTHLHLHIHTHTRTRTRAHAHTHTPAVA